jgi:O-antigen/teichoic acid export membrane protein
MKQKFISNLILLLALNLLIKPVYILGIDAEVQNRVGPQIYGSYAALISLSFLLNILLDLGIQNYNTRNISRYTHLLAKHFPRIIVLRFMMVFLYMAVLLGAGYLMGYRDVQIKHLALLGLNQALAAFILFFRSNLSGLHLFKQDSLVSVLDRALLIIMMGALLWGGITSSAFDITWFIWGQTIAYSFAFLVSLLLVLRQSGKFNPIYDKAFNAMILKNSMPYALLFFVMSIYYRSDSIMLERLLGDGDYYAGVYAMGFRLFEAANMIAYLFAILLLPIFARLLREKKSIEAVAKLAFKILFSGSMILAFTCYFFDTTILELRYSSEIDVAAPIFGILMFSFVFFAISYVFGTLMTAAGQLRKLNIIAVIGMVINVGLNLLLIWEWKAYGCAIASFSAHALVAVAQVYLSIKFFKFKKDPRLLIQIGLFVLGLITLAWLSTIIEANELLKVGVFMLGGLALSLLTGLFQIGGIIELIRSRE